MLQKVLYTKNNGDEGYRFQILCPFSAMSRKTLAEHIENRAPERIDYLVAHTKDKDERDKNPMRTNSTSAAQAYHAQAEYYAQSAPVYTSAPPPSPSFDNDIGF